MFSSPKLQFSIPQPDLQVRTASTLGLFLHGNFLKKEVVAQEKEKEIFSSVLRDSFKYIDSLR